MQTLVPLEHTQAQEWMAAKSGHTLKLYRTIRHDAAMDPGMNVGHWVYLIVGAIVLVLVVAALMGPLKTGLASYAANDTTFGPILQNIVPILIGAAILLAFVGAFFARRAGYF